MFLAIALLQVCEPSVVCVVAAGVTVVVGAVVVAVVVVVVVASVVALVVEFRSSVKKIIRF